MPSSVGKLFYDTVNSVVGADANTSLIVNHPKTIFVSGLTDSTTTLTIQGRVRATDGTTGAWLTVQSIAADTAAAVYTLTDVFTDVRIVRAGATEDVVAIAIAAHDITL